MPYHTTGPMRQWQMSGSFPAQARHTYLVIVVLEAKMHFTERQREHYINLLFTRIGVDAQVEVPQSIDYERVEHTFHILRDGPHPGQRFTLIREVASLASCEELRFALLEAIGTISSPIVQFRDLQIASLD